MKKLIIVICIIFFSCNEKKSNKENLNSEILKTNEKHSTVYNEGEKIDEKTVLISIIENIPKDTLSLIVNDYLKSTELVWPIGEQEKIKYNKLIDSLSVKYKIKKTKIARAIFSYKYGMNSKE